MKVKDEVGIEAICSIHFSVCLLIDEAGTANVTCQNICMKEKSFVFWSKKGNKGDTRDILQILFYWKKHPGIF